MPRRGRRFLVPEVIQMSAMDCGPAALKALLDGYRRPVSYGRLRESCQTDVDGTSIDTLEEVARRLGLDAEQVMAPLEHLFLPHARLLPAVVVVRLPDGVPHFVVMWRRVGPWLQIMDPAVGRRWIHVDRFRARVLRVSFRVEPDEWRALAMSGGFRRGLTSRLRELGASRRTIRRWLAESASSDDWRGMARLDAATRMVTALVEGGGVLPGGEAARLLDVVLSREQQGERVIPAAYLGVVEDTSDPDAPLTAAGAVLVRVRGRRSVEERDDDAPVTPELTAALESKRERPMRTVLRLLRDDGLFAPAVVSMVLLLAALTTLSEALVFRSFLELGRDLSSVDCWLFLGATLALMVGSMALDWSLARSLLGMGRRLEGRLRIAFQSKVARLADQYFRSRTIADMAERVYGCQAVRALPMVSGQLLRLTAQLALIAAGMIWLDPAAMVTVTVAATGVVLAPLLLQRVLIERELRVRSHRGGLGRFFLDALLGLVPVRVHGAESALRREHEGALVEWYRAGLHLRRGQVGAEGLSITLGFGAAGLVILEHLMRRGAGGSTLLLLYWALRLPELGQQIAQLIALYPAQRNAAARVTEALGAPEEAAPTATHDSSRVSLAPDSNLAEPSDDAMPRRSGLRAAGATLTVVGSTSQASRPPPPPPATAGCTLDFESVDVLRGGHLVLRDVTLHIDAGEHVAIIGRSGAGKSTLVGLLLGWHRPSRGALLVDGRRLDANHLASLRAATAWVDPSVQLWNRSLLENVTYGATDPTRKVARTLEQAGATSLLAALDDGLQTSLGESGARLSGGEGQRVRLARGLYRDGVRLALLDEALRGLSREQRRERLREARHAWKRATLLAVTHDIADTRSFDRVVVVEDGAVIEIDAPAALLGRPSRYRDLLQAEEAMWQRHLAHGWRRARIEDGTWTEEETTG